MGETIKLTADDGHECDAYLAKAETEELGRLVVVQEIFGVNVHIRDVCDRFAAKGYTALAPAVFDRVGPGIELGYDEKDVTEGRALRAKVPDENAALDLKAAQAYLAPGGSVGIVGYCWGGTLVWLAASMGGYAAAVGYYGGHIIEIIDRDPKCPTMLHFGDQDAGIPLSDVEKIRAAYPEVTIHIYEGAGHGFNCDHRGSYDAGAAATALERTLAFFGTHLG